MKIVTFLRLIIISFYAFILNFLGIYTALDFVLQSSRADLPWDVEGEISSF